MALKADPGRGGAPSRAPGSPERVRFAGDGCWVPRGNCCWKGELHLRSAGAGAGSTGWSLKTLGGLAAGARGRGGLDVKSTLTVNPRTAAETPSELADEALRAPPPTPRPPTPPPPPN